MTVDPNGEAEHSSPDNPGTKNPGCMVNDREGFCTNVETCQQQNRESLKGEAGPDGKFPCHDRGKDTRCCVGSAKEAPPPPPDDESCTVNDRNGTCMDEKACRAQKKEPLEGGKGPDVKPPCKGGPNIQCCVVSNKGPPKGPLLPLVRPEEQQDGGKGCTVDNRDGSCTDEKLCLAQKKEPLKGEKGPDGKWPCGGGSNIQCCVAGKGAPPNESSPPIDTRQLQPSDGKQCSVNNRDGVCKDTASCQNENKEPLFRQKGPDGEYPCTGGNNIQCCVNKKKKRRRRSTESGPGQKPAR